MSDWALVPFSAQSELALTPPLAASLGGSESWCPTLRVSVPPPPPADVSRAVELLERLQRSGELPPQKLQALQRVLQSRFCSAIREVSRQGRTQLAAAVILLPSRA